MPAAKSPTDESIISVDDVVKEFGPLRVLDGVSLDVARGQTVAIVGRSGSGKSTLLRCIAGLETVQGGDDHGLRPSRSAGRAAPRAPSCAATSAWCSRATISSRISPSSGTSRWRSRW